MKGSKPRLVAVAVVAGLLLSGLIWALTHSMQRMPDFYRRCLNVPWEQSVEDGRLFERRLVELSNQMRLDTRWSMVWSASQINGWLAADLPEKFPHALPASIQEPRVAISGDGIQVAFRLESPSLRGIVRIQGDVFATDRENQIAFRISQVKSGILPIPISWWAARLQQSLRGSDIILEWSEIERDPVALITLPVTFSGGEQRHSVLEAIQLSSRGLGISGRTVHHPLPSHSVSGGGSGSRDSVQASGDVSADSRASRRKP
jgi:hypothetical protein